MIKSGNSPYQLKIQFTSIEKFYIEFIEVKNTAFSICDPCWIILKIDLYGPYSMGHASITVAWIAIHCKDKSIGIDSDIDIKQQTLLHN